MAIELFRHNEEAYNSALKMLKTSGKAAIIHPTGTGKSFIGFKLCEDFPQKSICWLSPPLGSWLNTQRSVYSGRVKGKLSDSQIGYCMDKESPGKLDFSTLRGITICTAILFFGRNIYMRGRV